MSILSPDGVWVHCDGHAMIKGQLRRVYNTKKIDFGRKKGKYLVYYKIAEPFRFKTTFVQKIYPLKPETDK